MSHIKDVTVENISSLLDNIREAEPDVGVALNWYRGHSSSDYHLVPGVHRSYASRSECWLAHKFIQGAPTRHAKCPSSLDDFAGWLSLMQHYRLPTRLLDWTSSPLVAAYFAVDRSCDPEDAAIWKLAPGVLNHHFQISDIPWLHGAEVEYLVHSAINGWQDSPSKDAIAVVSQEIDIRMTVQQGFFTIHGDATPLEEIPNAGEFLAKIIIPRNAKATIKKDLRVLGIRQSTLFPDLENLASELSGDDRWKIGSQ
jgi:hypothetical protein